MALLVWIFLLRFCCASCAVTLDDIEAGGEWRRRRAGLMCLELRLRATIGLLACLGSSAGPERSALGDAAVALVGPILW